MSFPGAVGKKRGMTQVFDEDGSAVPVTVIELLPLTVTQVKTKANDGYTAVQIGYQESK
jgi:large subunit ribosomal protein L3